MRRSVICAVSLLLSVFVVHAAFAASFTFELKGLPEPSGIESFTMFLNVEDTFSYTTITPGPAIPENSRPGDSLYSWSITASLGGGVFAIDFLNEDAFDLEKTFFNSSTFQFRTETELGTDSPPSPWIQVSDGQYNQNNLLNGVLATVEITAGSVLGIDALVLSGWDDLNQVPAPISYELVASLNPDGSGVTAAVPLPSTLLLLGGGLAGIFGLKRRKRS